MRSVLPAAVGVCAVLALTLLTACNESTEDQPTPSAAAPTSTVPARPVPEPQAATAGPCPYLDQATVEQANGQRVSDVRISADQPYPACFFERADGSVQMRTWIVQATPEVAIATVDAAAPVATSDLAELPGGWSGGSQPTDQGAVFAVAKEGTAVIVTTNQKQTVKAREIAQQLITDLGL